MAAVVLSVPGRRQCICNDFLPCLLWPSAEVWKYHARRMRVRQQVDLPGFVGSATEQWASAEQ